MTALYNLIAFLRRELCRRCNYCAARRYRTDMFHRSFGFWYCDNDCSHQDWIESVT